MAEDDKKTPEVTQKKEVTVDNEKTPKVEVEKETTVAPVKDETKVEEGSANEAPDAENIDDVIQLLNIFDSEVGGKGEITGIPDELKGSIQFLIKKLVDVREMFEDPLFVGILDDMVDQKEDGQIPSVEVAIARSIPMQKLQELADNEDYAGAQGALSESLNAQKQTEEDDAAFQVNFDRFKQDVEEYSAEMGYDEARKTQLVDKVMEIMKMMGDGKLTKVELAEIDKLLNYDSDIEALTAQISEQDNTKEVLPDQASVEATVQTKTPAAPVKQADAPGMGSMGYDAGAVDVTQVGKRKRVR